MTDIAENRVFLRRALRRPATIGAPAPTSPALAARIADFVPRSGRPTVVELGPGTGPISREIAARLPQGARFAAVELDPGMVEYLRRTQPALEVLPGDVADLPELLGAAGIGPVDVVVSSVPWTLLPAGSRRGVLAGIARSMDPAGTFVTISTLTAAPNLVRTLRADLDTAFGQVRASRVLWRNVPPSRLLIATGPRA